jgi:hypothetical protein
VIAHASLDSQRAPSACARPAREACRAAMSPGGQR